MTRTTRLDQGRATAPRTDLAGRAFSRRAFLGGALAAGVAAPLAGEALLGRSAAHATAGLPLRILNNTGSWASSDVWVTLVGTSPTQGDGFLDASGAFHPLSLSDNSNPDGTAAWGFTLADAAQVPLPDFSGRAYVSLGQQLPFKVVQTANGLGRQDPIGWVAGQPGWDITYDFIEFTNNGSGMHINVTAVDMFSIPMSITLTGASRQTTGALRSGGRAAVFDAVRGTAGWEQLVVDDRRVIAPSHGIDSGLFSGSYFDGYIDEVWSTYAGSDLTVDAGASSYRLRVEGGQLNAYSGSSVVTSFAKPSTHDVLYCDGNLSAPNDGTRGPIAAILGAGFNRTTLLSQSAQPATDPGSFYAADPVHAYAKALHAQSVDGRSYAFAFDDVAGFASYVEDGAPTDVAWSIDAL